MRSSLEKNGISVVMPIYLLTSATDCKAAVESVLNQTKAPRELVIVLDGLINREVEIYLQSLGSFQNSTEIKIVRLEENLGPGIARAYGVEASSFETIAWMDSDDVSMPLRLERQFYALWAESDLLDVVGAWIKEINESNIIYERRMPEQHHEIALLSRFRSPLNNVTAMFKRSVYQRVMNGVVNDLRFGEDYYVWMRMLGNGVRFKNLQEVLVEVDVSKGFFSRRGIYQLPQEIELLRRLRKEKLLKTRYFFLQLLYRVLIRSTPIFIRKYFYSWIRVQRVI